MSDAGQPPPPPGSDAPPPPPPPPAPAAAPAEDQGKKRRWWPVAGALVLLVGAALVVAVVVSGGGGDGTFDDEAYPFTFEYPGDWEESDDVTLDQELGSSGLDRRAVALDDTNGIIIERFELNIEVDEDNIDLAKDELDGLLTGIDSDADGQVGETAGFPSVTYENVSVPVPEGAESKIVALFDGDQEYMLNCQSTEDHRDEVDEGCQQALDTLEPK